MIAVVTDSTADFAGLSPEELGIQVVPLTVNWGSDILRDKIDITTEEFYQRLRVDRNTPKTAAPPVGIFEDLYKNLLTEHEAVVSIHIASKLSATSSVAEGAARAIGPDRIHIIDSETVSVGVGWLAVTAAEMARSGAQASDVVDVLRAMVPRIRLQLTLETLEFLARGGRIGRASAFVGGLLNVKPILQVKDGEVHPIERVRNRPASIRKVAELAHALGKKQHLAIVHGDCLDEAEALRSEVERLEGRTDIPIAEIGSVLGTHAGPGVIGIGSVLAG